MNTKIIPQATDFPDTLEHSKTIFDGMAKKLLLKKLVGLKKGNITVMDATSGSMEIQTFGELHAPSDLIAVVNVRRSQFYSRVVFGGTVGAGESYTDHDWDCEQLTALIRIFVLNREVMNGIDGGFGAILLPFRKLTHYGVRRNSIKGSRENIHAHYDLGNEFFALFLDETRMYSSAMFQTPNQSLEDAAVHKIDTICKKLKLKSTDHLIEIGTGWGGFAIHAAKHHGCRVTTTTISQEQFNHAKMRIKEEGLEDRITLLFEDYRNLSGTYDKLVSIEMIEAVGLEYLGTFFEKCSSLLKPEGLMVLQAITIRDQFYEEAKRSVDFIQKCIFPGSGIPSIQAMMSATTEYTDLALSHQEDFGQDYARTLNLWASRLKARETDVVKLGYPASLARLWQFYCSYCEGGFIEKSIGVSQLVFQKPQYREAK